MFYAPGAADLTDPTDRSDSTLGKKAALGYNTTFLAALQRVLKPEK
jgi:hypothetical protein